jgi:indole-3-glycerol phosphate synthase
LHYLRITTITMNILDKINAHKAIEVAERQKQVPLAILQQSASYSRTCVSLQQAIRTGSGVIAEFKRKSPSKGIINASAQVADVTVGYAKAGASALSVLTDTEFFGGSTQDLEIARKYNTIPILRKDFIVDSYQIYEAKAMGADAILLIAASLAPKTIQEFTDIAHQIGLEVLLEVHDAEELQNNIQATVDVLGVNNRSLKTFEVSLQVAVNLSTLMPKNMLCIAESGITSLEDMQYLRKYGYQGFLIGESFMKTDTPHKTLADFLGIG